MVATVSAFLTVGFSVQEPAVRNLAWATGPYKWPLTRRVTPPGLPLRDRDPLPWAEGAPGYEGGCRAVYVWRSAKRENHVRGLFQGRTTHGVPLRGTQDGQPVRVALVEPVATMVELADKKVGDPINR